MELMGGVGILNRFGDPIFNFVIGMWDELRSKCEMDYDNLELIKNKINVANIITRGCTYPIDNEMQRKFTKR